jgi:glutathione S-transferase
MAVRGAQFSRRTTQPWPFFKFTGDTTDTPDRKLFDSFFEARPRHMETVLAGREWLAGKFSIADILMSDVLPRRSVRWLATLNASRGYVARATARPAFVKAQADQLAHFAAAD